ncbi:hypothetical protein [Haloglomus litoreum]|uniref:hypothetical protein n=1 Tax=Haloglomus litoreum TaxID=3034026 RepID=UPI0023E83F2F|nr:hypothetical protein [Haloglomus sp. DT116]
MGTTPTRAVSTPVPSLPRLDPGVTLLETETHAVGPIDSLVLDHLLGQDGTAVWVDSHDHATTQQLARLAPSRRLLERVRVARGFTPFQHYELVDRLGAEIGPETALVVVPWADAPYRDDSLGRGDTASMMRGVADRLTTLADRASVPVLVTLKKTDSVTEPFDALSTRDLLYEATDLGPRFVGDSFETLVYPVDNGGVQTTLAFWERVLQRRHALAESETPRPGVA